MRKKFELIVITLLILGTTGCGTTTVSYLNRLNSKRYKLKIPKDHQTKEYMATSEKESRYIYGDSSVIYITNFLATPNYRNIKMLGDSVLEFRYQDEDLTRQVQELLGESGPLVIPDTFELSGKDENDLHWRDIKIGKLSIGYMKVPAPKKVQFDKALESLVAK